MKTVQLLSRQHPHTPNAKIVYRAFDRLAVSEPLLSPARVIDSLLQQRGAAWERVVTHARRTHGLQDGADIATEQLSQFIGAQLLLEDSLVPTKPFQEMRNALLTGVSEERLREHLSSLALDLDRDLCRYGALCYSLDSGFLNVAHEAAALTRLWGDARPRLWLSYRDKSSEAVHVHFADREEVLSPGLEGWKGRILSQMASRCHEGHPIIAGWMQSYGAYHFIGTQDLQWGPAADAPPPTLLDQTKALITRLRYAWPNAEFMHWQTTELGPATFIGGSRPELLGLAQITGGLSFAVAENLGVRQLYTNLDAQALQRFLLNHARQTARVLNSADVRWSLHGIGTILPPQSPEAPVRIELDTQLAAGMLDASVGLLKAGTGIYDTQHDVLRATFHQQGRSWRDAAIEFSERQDG